MARPATRPEQVMPWERWIDVDLELQTLVAYEGDVPVYATLISSGKKGSEEESFLTTPFVPEGWHGVNAHEGAPGSMVVIH